MSRRDVRDALFREMAPPLSRRKIDDRRSLPREGDTREKTFNNVASSSFLDKKETIKAD